MGKPGGRNRFSNDPPPVIGHRGAAGHAPENTLVSIQKAFDLGARWVEFDVMLSADGVPILFHDDKLKRITGQKGLTAEHTLAQLKKLDAGRWFAPAFAGEPIPTLTEALALLAKLGMGANVEVKPTKGLEAETGRVVGAALARDWPDNLPAPLISSFSTAALRSFAAAAPAYPRALLVWPMPKDWRRQLEDLGCVAMHCLSRKLREPRARDVLAAGYGLRAFTVNHAGRARQLFEWGVDGVFTDYPDRILKIL